MISLKAIPRFDVGLSDLPVLGSTKEFRQQSWQELLATDTGGQATVLVTMQPVWAAVITQDCDALRSPMIALCEIAPFREVEPSAKDISSPKQWVKKITKHARVNQKWYYLPPEQNIGFTVQMGVDFQRVLTIQRDDLDAMRREFRAARLNETALAHFRERIGEFFRRYAYDEWYPLSRDEFEAYNKGSGPVTPYSWQS